MNVPKRHQPIKKRSPNLHQNHQPAIPNDLLKRLPKALELLVQAQNYASDLAQETWSFAVEIKPLREAGLNNSDLRWLVLKGYVEHARETTAQESKKRTFETEGGLAFARNSCFILTETGAALARQVPGNPDASKGDNDTAWQKRPAVSTPGRPHWDKERLELRVDTFVVKRYKRPAPNQERILAAFEEEGWPHRVDDPLPPRLEQNSKRRLHDTIVALNRHHQDSFLRFSGDGTGQGVCWELVHPAHTDTEQD